MQHLPLHCQPGATPGRWNVSCVVAGRAELGREGNIPLRLKRWTPAWTAGRGGEEYRHIEGLVMDASGLSLVPGFSSVTIQRIMSSPILSHWVLGVSRRECGSRECGRSRVRLKI